MTKTKKRFSENWLFVLAPLFVLIGLAVFLFGKDNGTTGAQALAMQSTSFWVVAAIGLAIASACIYFAIRVYKNAGSTKVSTILTIVAVVIAFSVFGKACESKADPVTAPKYGSK
jgi:cytochrome bd-type quinol oxidase subunit 2